MADVQRFYVSVSTERDDSSVNFYLTGNENSQFLKHSIAKAFYLADIFPNHDKDVLIEKYKDYLKFLLEKAKPKILEALQKRPRINIICYHHKNNIYLEIFLQVLKEIFHDIKLCQTSIQEKNLS